MGFDEMQVPNFVVEKWKELWVAMGDFWGQFSVWFGKMYPPETRGDEAQNFVVEKLKELWLAMKDFWGQFMYWFDKVFPPEIREKLQHWLAVALTFLIPALVLITFYCCCKFCGWVGIGIINMMKIPFRMLRNVGRGIIKMIKVPFRMLRNVGRGIIKMIKVPFRILRKIFSSCCGGRRVRTMKAPGRNFRMPRSVFEASPKSYFSGLRAHPGYV